MTRAESTVVRTLTLSFLFAATSPAAADPTRVLRFAAVAPEGTAWAREGRSLAQMVESGTQGQVTVKWYLGGIAGDDAEMGERVRRDQLDGVASGGPLCEQLSPTMRVLHIPGLYRSRNEWAYVVNELRPDIDKELLHAGFVNLGEAGIGPSIILSRKPIATMQELRQSRLWVWDTLDSTRATMQAMSITPVPLPLPRAASAYAAGEIDGFFAVPIASLAFQWSSQASYFTDLEINYLTLCLIIREGALDPLSLEQQRVIRSAGAHMTAHFDDVGRTQDRMLIDGLFEHQGLKRVPVSDTFLRDFYASGKQARDQLGERLVPRALIERVTALLASYRAGGGH